MSKNNSHESFKDFLAHELSIRKVRNPRYSLRAFARDIGISHSRLSEILSSTAGISLDSGRIVCRNLELGEMETEFLLDLIRREYGKTDEIRQAAQQRISSRSRSETFDFAAQSFTILDDWYYLPILEFLTLNQTPSVEVIAKNLALPVDTVAAALTRLLAEEFVIKGDDGHYSRRTTHLKFESPIPSEKIRQFHSGYLSRAQNAVETQDIKNRKFLTSILSFAPEDLIEARAEIEKFNAAFLRKYSGKSNASSVYCASLAFYQVGEGSNV